MQCTNLAWDTFFHENMYTPRKQRYYGIAIIYSIFYGEASVWRTLADSSALYQLFLLQARLVKEVATGTKRNNKSSYPPVRIRNVAETVATWRTLS